ncbi:MAG: hypothetical protein P8P30_07960 [Rickettsiales bacterium]|nr:hypothetical protein [Rickettsiales bacterium]
MKYLFKTPNKLISKDEFRANNIKYDKRPSQIISDLGFKGGLAKVFFTASEKGITFHNPVSGGKVFGKSVMVSLSPYMEFWPLSSARHLTRPIWMLQK